MLKHETVINSSRSETAGIQLFVYFIQAVPNRAVSLACRLSVCTKVKVPAKFYYRVVYDNTEW